MTNSDISTGLGDTKIDSQIWVIEDDVALRVILEDTLTEVGYKVKTFGQAQLAWEQLNNIIDNTVSSAQLPNVIITDIRMPMMNGLVFSEKVHKNFPTIPVIIMTAHADVQSAVDSYQTGAFDYLPKPFELDDVINVVQKACQQSSQNITTDPKTSHNSKVSKATDNKALQQNEPFSHAVINNNSTQQSTNPSGIIGQSMAMQKVFQAIGRLSNMPMTVLITGESGTGKELIASALHEHSVRKNKPFIALNMAAIPHDLIEAELFGHEKGAFTGATTTRQGRFEQAHGGTLFLDEIGDMPLPTQTRLLRVLSNGEFFRIGGQKPIKVDVRIIAATHQHLEDLVKQGKFREDLFYRLNVIRIALPALRERIEDIPLLIQFFMKNIANTLDTANKTLTPQAMQILQQYNWRGNVRQLENTCRWLTVMTAGHIIQATDLPPEILQFQNDNIARQTHLANNDSSPKNTDPSLNTKEVLQDASNLNSVTIPNLAKPNTLHSESLNQTMPAQLDWLTPLQSWAKNALEDGQHDILQTATPMFEKCLLQVALEHTGKHKGQAADLLGWGRNTVTRKYQQLIDDKE